ncbi:hypothetical protein GIY23_17860 [Allosaccharopolyspora coralli]|uniref:Uncharacterized protein n=1 Tax=Allosaccharopolyspora coralli TaxID=2665642 RepID=A0A5Q3QD80_9PSEU|nr:hypothetical protein GIY23_17860 [Allosaccharopolyspora coralli]
MSATVLGLIAVAIVETFSGGGFGGFVFGALGALVGVITLPMVTQSGLLIGSAVFGLRVRHVELGAMRGLVSWTWRRTTFTVRALPVVLASEIGPWRSPVILRCWLAGLTSALAGIASVVSVWLLTDGSFWRGVLVAATPLMISKLWPRRAPLTTSTGWLLFGLPRMPEPKRTEFCAGPYAAQSYELLKSGDVDAAQAVVDELSAAHPDLNTTNSCQVTMLEARGEYAQAVALLLGHMSTHDIPPRELSYTLAGLAGLGLTAVESGQADAETLLPISRKALTDAIALGYPEFKLGGTRALLALLDDEPEQAIELAETSADHATSPMSRADDHVTVARAHMALRDNASARLALDKAEACADWWPRVRATRQRLSV